MVRARLHNRIDLLYSGRYEEARANAEVFPGTALITDANGEVGPNDANGVAYDVMIALSNQKLGKTIDQSWASGDLVSYIIPLPGDVCVLVLESGEAVGLDDFLTVTSSGSFAVAATSDQRLFKPLEALAGTGSGDRFIKARRV